MCKNIDRIRRIKSYTGKTHFSAFNNAICNEALILWLYDGEPPTDEDAGDVNCKECLIKMMRVHPDMLSQGELYNLITAYSEELHNTHERITGKVKEVIELMKRNKVKS